MGTQQQWNRLVPLWTEALRQKPALHMKSLRWKKDHTRELLARLGPIPNQCELTPVLGGVRVKDYEDLIAGTPARKLLKGYVACIYPLVINILRHISSSERLEIVFEQQREYQPYTECALAAIVSLRNQRPQWFLTADGLPKLAKWRFVPKNSTILTQPADYFFYALRHLYQDKSSKKTKWCRPILESGGGEGIGAVMNRKQVRQSMIQLPFMAMRAQVLRKIGELEELKIEPHVRADLEARKI